MLARGNSGSGDVSSILLFGVGVRVNVNVQMGAMVIEGSLWVILMVRKITMGLAPMMLEMVVLHISTLPLSYLPPYN